MYDTIVVPTDGSENARRAADHAVDIAARTGATVHALSVVDATRLGPFTPTDIDVSEIRSSLRREAEEATEGVVERCRAASVDCIAAVRVGVPHEAIREYSDEVDADLVVVGTHGRTGLPRAVLGSVAERVVRASDAPVLTVGPD
jgi:nucleotide-binding universal stress UspA family protein